MESVAVIRAEEVVASEAAIVVMEVRRKAN